MFEKIYQFIRKKLNICMHTEYMNIYALKYKIVLFTFFPILDNSKLYDVKLDT